MKTLHFKLLTIALCCTAGSYAMAQNISKADLKLGKDKISATYKLDKTACDSLSANAKDICIAEAKGKEKIARAELEASYEPSVKKQYEVRIAKANSTYAVAKEKCDDLAGNSKDVCVKEAKAADVAAKADAKVQMKTTDANAKANEKASAAQAEARSDNKDATKDAAKDKMEADYKVAAEKCDSLAGAAKDNCIAQAKVRFGK